MKPPAWFWREKNSIGEEHQENDDLVEIQSYVKFERNNK
jgi:hypothetical protein